MARLLHRHFIIVSTTDSERRAVRADGRIPETPTAKTVSETPTRCDALTTGTNQQQPVPVCD